MEQQQTIWKEVNPQVWKPEQEGDVIEGVLLSKREGVGVNESKIYTLETTKGTLGVWGSTILDQRMEIVNIGDRVRITFKGKEKNKRNQDLKIFKVEVAQK